jgi:hypothetical protein
MKTIFYRIVLLIDGMALALVGLALVDFLFHPLAPDSTFNSPIFRAVVMLVLTPLTLLVGFLIMRRVPGNVVGPLLIAWSGSVVYNAVREGIGPVPFALFSYYNIAYGWLALFLMMLHFPNGKIHPASWTPWIYRLLGINVVYVNLIFFSFATFQIPSQMANPFYIPALVKQADLILRLGFLGFVPLLVLALVSPVLRYRQGSHLERQQIKWLALFAVVIIPYTILGLILFPLLTGGDVMNPGDNLFGIFFFIIVGLFPAIAIGVAVLRHRLWDIDIIIHRTLVYSILTVSLTVVFFGSVALLQSLFTTVIGHQSPAAIVISTLAIAVLVTPLRRGIQERIDRRFYRHKYDAEQVLANCGMTLRDEADLERLTDSILGVVEETMQPTKASLWVRKADFVPRENLLSREENH